MNITTNIKSNELSYELVERKGLGHPDTLADGVAEVASIAYSDFCQRQFGHILHHNFDKVYLRGGQARIKYGHGVMETPIECYLNGRVSSQFAGQAIPVHSILVSAASKYLATRLPNLDIEKDIRFVDNTFSFSHLENWCTPQSLDDLPEALSPRANDTSIGFGLWPPSKLESLVASLEGYFYDEALNPNYSEFGQDIKVLAYRQNRTVSIVISAPIVPHKLASYKHARELIYDTQNNLEAFLTQVADHRFDYNLSLNPDSDLQIHADAEPHLYRTYLGSALDGGDEGIVGRGNRPSGFISSGRWSSAEAVCGKNPTYHVGKVYTYLAERLAQSLASDFKCEVEVGLTSAVGQSLYTPFHIGILSSREISVHEVERRFAELANQSKWIESLVDDAWYLPTSVMKRLLQ